MAKWQDYGSYASLLIQATDQRRSKKPFGLQSTSARFQRKCFFPLSANLRKIQFMVFPTMLFGVIGIEHVVVTVMVGVTG